MEKKKVSTLRYLINLSFFLYFIVLFAERVVAVVLSLNKGVPIFNDFYHGFTYILVFLSLGLTVLFLALACRPHFVALFTMDEEKHNKVNYRLLSIASGIILVSGMIHLDENISGLQFGAYGVLIVGLLLQTIINNKTSKNRFTLWLSFVYVVCFAMAVPVMYPFNLDHAGLVYAFEAITMLLLVAFFALFEIKMFADEGDNLFFLVPFILTVGLDVTILCLRWPSDLQLIKDANIFVLIFLIATAAVFLVYFGYRCIQKINNKD